jgi:pyrimidine deaminase RibD-like protein/GNAT superfamily N-acetyltransferase
MNFHELDNFNLADAVKFHSRLNPKIWGSDEHLLPEVREKLQAIAADFQEFLGVDDLRVQDLTISGSNAAYSYTPHSDIDLHLVVEMPDDPVYQELFNAKKYQYNDEHDIRIAGVPVELYVQPADQKHISQGIYSVKNSEWNQVPQRRRARIDDSCVQHKAADLDARIHAAIKSGDAENINRLWDRIKDMRKTSLEKNGEFGCENIAFKLLRNRGCIDKLWKAKAAVRDRELSLEQSKKPRKRVNYGMRDYWYPGTAYAGQDHPAGTESEQVDEAVSGPKIVVVGDSIALGIATAMHLPPEAYDAVIGRSTGKILKAASNPRVQDADVAIVSSGTNDYPLPAGINNNPDATISNISRTRDALKAKQYVWILPFNRNAARDVQSAIGGDAYVDLAAVAKTTDRLHPTSYSDVAKAAWSKFAKPGIMESADPDHLKKILHRFYDSCVDKLKLKNPPRLHLETTPDWSRENGSFGQYESETNTLILATAGRHVLDILRTMAHEMTHRQQDEQEPLPIDAGETGSPWEDQANAMAGRIMRQWAEEQPEMFDGVTLEEARESNDLSQRDLNDVAKWMATTPDKIKIVVKQEPIAKFIRQIREMYGTYDEFPEDEERTNRILRLLKRGEQPMPIYVEANDPDLFVMEGRHRMVAFWLAGMKTIPVAYASKIVKEASGYIPTKAQAKDPRFVMALTRDVRPGAVGKEANKLGLETDSQGHPALLTAGLQKLLREFKEQDLFEIRMSPTSLRREAAKTGALAGMEFEMIVPNTQSEDEYDQEPDYDQDERASSPRDIRDFFYDGDFNSRRSVDGLIDSMMNDFSEWQSEEFDTRWESDSEQMIYDYIKDNMDDDDVRGLLDLEEEDPVGRNEYQLAADKITAEQIQPWYEDAQESAREEFYENDDGFEEWLSDAELAYMSDIERRYSGDVTWPHYRNVSSGEGASVQETADSFSQAVGRPARANDSYHEYGQERPAPGKNFYVVEPDGSLEPDDSDDAGLEFVSPPLPIDEIMSDLNKVKKWADQNGCYTNDSTGLHINISVPNYDLGKLDFVKLALLMGDEYVLQQFGRVSNTYAKSAMKKVRDHVQKRPYEAKYLLDKMKGHMGELASKAIHSGITDKYTSINTKDGHVEFRSPGGDWLGDNFSKIENTLLRFTVALSAAMDPKAYREEYLKKLYKILAPNGEKDPLAVFAKYAAGELPADALKSFVRQAQADRKAKKSGEAIVNGHRWRVSLKPELGGGVVEVMATDPIDAKKQAIIQQPNWKFVDDSALTIERLDEPAAGASTTGPHPEGRGRPNDPNGRLAIVNRDDPLVFAYGHGTPGPAPNYLFRFTLPDGYSQAQLRAVMAAWAARENANAADYMVVDTTQFLAPAAPESASVQWNIIDRNNNLVHTFWNRNVQRDANAAAHEWLMANDELPSVDMQGPFDIIPAAGSQVAFIPGSTLDLQRQRQAADVAANTRRWADYEASQAATPTPVPGVQDIEIEIPPAQTQWEVYDRNTDRPVFRMYAADQAEAWRKGQEWVANYARMTPDQPIYGIDYSVRQSTAPVSEGRENDRISFQVQKGKNRFATAMKVNDQQVGVYQYNANTGRSVAEVYPEFKGKGLGKLLVLHAIYTAAQLGLDFQEDESRTSAYDNVLDSLSSNGYIVDDDGRWYVTGKGEQYLTQSVKQDVTEGRKPFRDLKSWSDHAKSQGLKVSEPSNHIDWTHDATDKQGNVRGRFVRTRVPQNSRGFIHQQDVNENRLIGSLVRNTMNFGRNIGTKAKPAVTVFTNPANQGAMIRQAAQAYPVKELPLSKLRLNEPDSKMANPANRMTVMSMVDTIKKGGELPPIIVVPKNFNYTILDGHHRYAAYKLAGVENVPVKILDPKDVKYTDIVDPDLARTTNESREITKLHKLDSVLEKCIEMIRRGYESNPEKYGRVAACVIDNKNNHTYAINMPGPGGTRRHAERMAIDKHLKRHGRIGPNAIMITTLSPCVHDMSERYGESCTDLLSDYGIEKCYAGWQDPTQHPAEDYPFNLQVTDNADIFNTCRDIAASFLPQTVAEGTEQITWIKPNFDYEWHEVEEQSRMEQVPVDVRQYYQKHFPNKDAWIQAVQHGRAVVVPPDHAYEIRNSPPDKASLQKVLAPTGHEGPIGPAKKKRVDALFAKGGPIEMPIVLKTSKGLWLIGGKTRLGTANYIKGIPAKVWVIGGKKDVDEAYTGPPMKFLKPGELSGGYSPQQMQAMGFKQTVNGTWYIPMSTWQRLVSGGQIREGAPAVKNVVVPPPATSDILSGRVPAGPDQITHAYRNMSPAELQHALETGHFQANPNPGRYRGWSPDQKFWSAGDEQGHFGRDWKNADDNVRVRVPIDRVPANTAVDASHAQVLDKTTGKWMPAVADNATKEITKTAAPAVAAKTIGKVAGKALPLVGTGLSIKDAYDRWQSGDKTGAVISALAGAGYLVPGPAGWVLGGGLDAANLARDMTK